MTFEDIRKFFLLLEFFHNKIPSTDEHAIAKPKISFIPTRHRDIILDTNTEITKR